MWAWFRAVENPPSFRGNPPHLAGGPALATPLLFVYPRNPGHGRVPAPSWVRCQAKVTAGSRACGCPFAGFGADPPFEMFVQWYRPPPIAVSVPLIFWLAT